ncbi:hypothetical protein ANCDUO_18643, partial [Ancylostoma duodenale]
TTGLRALVKAPLTLSPLGLEENENVVCDKIEEGVEVPRDEGTRSVSADSPRRTPSSEQPSPSPTNTASKIAAVSGKKPTLLNVVEDARGKKVIPLLSHVRRAASAATRSRVPLDMLDKAGPAPSMFEKATKMGMDFQTAAEKYKEYVESGAVQKVLDSDEVMAGYELDFLRLKQMDTDDKDSIDGGVKLWVGKDYVNYIHKDFVEVDLPFHGMSITFHDC